MRYIPTSAATVDSLKKQAKKLQRKTGGQHADLLNRVAKGAGYLHWHHVTQCLKQTEAKTGIESLEAECEIILRAAREGIEKIIVTGRETMTVPLVLFASQGDAWLLDPDENMALCLRFAGQQQDRSFIDAADGIEIDWDGVFALDGESFLVTTEHPLIGTRVIVGYPLDEIRRIIDKAQSFDKRFDTLILQDDAIDLTHDLVERLLGSGWERKTLDEAVANRARYSPSRNSILYPQMFGSSDDDDEDDDLGEPKVSSS
jgi:hypothetical protein